MRESIRIANVTPAQAAKWLEKNTGNRNAAESHIRFLAEEMKHGRFGLSQDAIAFNAKGELINGQHRLHAVVASGVTCRFLVLEGVPEDMKERLDLGRARSIPDMLKMLYGVDRATLVTGAIRVIDDFIDDRRVKLSVGHALEQIGRYDAGFKWAVRDIPGRSLFSISPIVAAMVYAHRTAPDQVEEFARKLSTGATLDEGSPALLFREFVHSRRGLFRTRADKREVFDYCLCAIRNHIKGSRGSKFLRLQKDIVSHFATAHSTTRGKAAA